jgi:adenylate kinase
MSRRRIVLLGAPGAGKGTQAVLLAARHALAHLSTGDLLRAAVKAGTDAGRAASAHMQAGRLVPDDVVFGVLFDRLAQETGGFVLDGFPRNRAQAEELDRRLAAQGTPLDLVIDVAVPDGLLVRRITGRRVCRACGRNFHVEFVPSRVPGRCDACAGELFQRQDDTAAVVEERLAVYHRLTAPLEDYYRGRGLLVAVDGTREVESVAADIGALLDGSKAGGPVAGGARAR